MLQSFISCAIGVWNVGYVMIAYGVADAVCSLVIGRLVKHTGFIPWFVLGKSSPCIHSGSWNLRKTTL